ncbi:acetyltransferase [Frigoribacterium faeni]|uniref:Acetyltransferase n=2 Tax=Frigoribacterium faeni TaxID=145483 RepID=A0ABQ0UT68_9MICO|nr:GNAT family protein [Microbacterium flavescens]GEK84645.1 acetyltransferase [Frigoribacterium faeni]
MLARGPGRLEAMTTDTRLPLLATDRLLLRSFEESDGAARLAYQGRADVSRYLLRAPHDAVSVMAGILRNQEGRFSERDDRLLYAVTTAADGVLVGEVSARLDDVGSAQVECGWVFHPEHGGRGYATEAVSALIGHLVDDRGAHRVYARLDADNAASTALCERLGMRREAHLLENELYDGRWVSEFVYAALALEVAASGR